MNYKLNHLYELTTESPASHYGIPIVVDKDGKAYGPVSVVPTPDHPEYAKRFFAHAIPNPRTFDILVHSWATERVLDDNFVTYIGMARTKEGVIAASKFLGQWPEGIQIDPEEIFENRTWKLNHKEDN